MFLQTFRKKVPCTRKSYWDRGEEMSGQSPRNYRGFLSLSRSESIIWFQRQQWPCGRAPLPAFIQAAALEGRRGRRLKQKWVFVDVSFGKDRNVHITYSC